LTRAGAARGCALQWPSFGNRRFHIEASVIRHALAALAVLVLLVPAAAGGQDSVSAADAAPFLGEWVLALEGANGPGKFNLSLRVEDDAVTGDIGSEQLATQKFTSISKNAGKGLSLAFAFPYEGMTVDAIVSLVPGTEGKMDAGIDFAGGAYTMSGTATKKE
jgi:hypothetical protein